ncbi:hypothetical protein PR048_010769 [Dryococelus australis]|uniref:Uncharacterized protein n=1 Tax=Dryococelus australis TaxID=614101 RepID=A0ABQ9I3M8_9NEOP|nr:hypothetical protein PR048_010769 [Dryococelus australis]
MHSGDVALYVRASVVLSVRSLLCHVASVDTYLLAFEERHRRSRCTTMLSLVSPATQQQPLAAHLALALCFPSAVQPGLATFGLSHPSSEMEKHLLCRRFSRTYTQHNDNTTRQFRILHLLVMAHLMRVTVSPLLLHRVSASNAEQHAAILLKSQWGRGGTVVRLLASHLGESGLISGGVAPVFSHVGTVPEQCHWSAGFLVYLPFSPVPFIPTLLHTHLTSPSSALNISMLRAAQSLPLNCTTLHFDIGHCSREQEETGASRETALVDGNVHRVSPKRYSVSYCARNRTRVAKKRG